MYKTVCILMLSAVVNGCASGAHHLGAVTLKDGSTVEYVQIGSKGQDGPKLIIIETYRYDPAVKFSEKVGAYHASGPSLTADILRGAVSAAAIAGGVVGAAAVLKPAETKINQAQSGGGAAITGSGNSTNTNTATGGAGGNATAGGGSVINSGSNCLKSGSGHLIGC